MTSTYGFHLGQPWWLLAGLVIVPMIWLARRNLAALGGGRRTAAVVLRILAVLILVVLLGPADAGARESSGDRDRRGGSQPIDPGPAGRGGPGLPVPRRDRRSGDEPACRGRCGGRGEHLQAALGRHRDPPQEHDAHRPAEPAGRRGRNGDGHRPAGYGDAHRSAQRGQRDGRGPERSGQDRGGQWNPHRRAAAGVPLRQRGALQAGSRSAAGPQRADDLAAVRPQQHGRRARQDSADAERPARRSGPGFAGSRASRRAEGGHQCPDGVDSRRDAGHPQFRGGLHPGRPEAGPDRRE